MFVQDGMYLKLFYTVTPCRSYVSFAIFDTSAFDRSVFFEWLQVMSLQELWLEHFLKLLLQYQKQNM